jgi:hypothetical protein
MFGRRDGLPAKCRVAQRRHVRFESDRGLLGTAAGDVDRTPGHCHAVPLAVDPQRERGINGRGRLTGFDIGADGSLWNRRVWADLGTGVPDGICIDAENAVWYADVPNRRCVRVREGGAVLQAIELRRADEPAGVLEPDVASGTMRLLSCRPGRR